MTQEQESSKETSRGGLWARSGFRGKSVWDWLELLIVPVVLAAAGLWFSVQQDERQQAIEDQRTQDAALQSYIDQISELMIHDNLNLYLTYSELQQSPETLAAFAAAKARTATVLVRLDSNHNKSAIGFLREGGLIRTGSIDVFSILWNINLSGADFRGVNFNRVGLWNSDLTRANLAQANLTYADLADANLTDANLTDANLTGANLSDRTQNTSDETTTVTAVQLTYSPDGVGANLTNANLTNANLIDANLTDANLKGADLTSANLMHTIGLTGERLEEQAASLEGATMPNGQKYEDWIKHPRPIDTRGSNTLPGGGPISMGEYVTEEFKPAFHYEVREEGWRALAPEVADLIPMARGPEVEYVYDEELLYFSKPPVVYGTSDPRRRIPAPENTAAWVSWFQSHPSLDTSKPVRVSVGGASGMQVDVTDINEPKTNRDVYRQFCGVRPCIPLMVMSSGRFIGPFRGTKYRFVIADVGGETVISAVGAPADNFSEFLPKAQKILDTVEWQE